MTLEPGKHKVGDYKIKLGRRQSARSLRNRIERMFGCLKIDRAIATRYDQRANSLLGMVHLAAARYRLKFVRAA